MGIRLRKSIKLMPGVKLNISKSGISTSLGGKGATVNIGKRGVRTSVGVPGTGIAFTSTSSSRSRQQAQRVASAAQETPALSGEVPARQLTGWLFLGILLMPWLFAWLTLQEGYGRGVRYLAFGWLAILVIGYSVKK